MKPKARLKKKEVRFGQSALASSETGMKKSDLSLLRKPVDINLSGLKQVAQLLEKGSEEVKAILTYECDIVYECRVCRSLFRSLANFISHKRVYCLQQYSVARCKLDAASVDSLDPYGISSIGDEGFSATGKERQESATLLNDKKDRPESLLPLIDPEYEESHTNDRILRSQSTKLEIKKDLTTIVDMLSKRLKDDAERETCPKRKRNDSPFLITSDREQILLEIIEPKHAAYQTVLGVEDCTATGTDLMKSQALELKKMLDRNTGILGPDGRLIAAGDLPGNGNYLPSTEEFVENPATSGNTTCALCNATFATKKTLAFHVKSKHVAHRMCYPCPCCTGIFTNRWSVYRHLFKVHRKTNEQVRRLRVQIQARAFRRESSRLEKAPRSTKEDGATEDCKNLISREWIENLELDAELQRCGECGKRFERRAALISHSQICQKRGTLGAAREARRKRARKLLPRRVSGTAVDTEPRSAGGLENESKTKTTEEASGFGSENRGVDGRKISAKEPSSSPKARSSMSGRKTGRCLVDPESKITSSNERSQVALSVERKSEVPSTDRKLEATLSIEVTGETLENMKSGGEMVDRNDADSTPDLKSNTASKMSNSNVCMPERQSASSLAQIQSEGSIIRQESGGSSSDRKSQSPPINGKKRTTSLIRPCDVVIPNGSPEISIRVEDVSSLSKDVWDKMGCDGGSSNSSSSSDDVANDRAHPLEGTIAEPTGAKTGARPDLPEVIYTSIENARPVALSVLATEKKLGIQYRGIRLPTVTLEKINISRCSSTNSNSVEGRSDKPCISLESSFEDGPVSTEIESNQLPVQKIPCVWCNRKFSTTANLKRHITVHTRRKRYRCRLCKDFKSLLKCDIIAHCNKVHNAKNDRATLAHLVMDAPMVTLDEKFTSQTSLSGTRTAPRDDLEVIDVASLSNAVQETIKAGIIHASLAVANDAETSSVDQTDVPPKPKRGRPPKSKAKRKRKPFVPRTKNSRHVSPPRLPDDTSSNEFTDFIEDSADQLTQETDRIKDDTSGRAPSRLEGDPELRKMIMEVIFGSSQKENPRHPRDDLDDRRSPALDNNDSDEAPDQPDNLVTRSPLTNATEIIDSDESDTKIRTNIVAQAANNNAAIGHCRNYKLSNTAVGSKAIFFTENQEVSSV